MSVLAAEITAIHKAAQQASREIIGSHIRQRLEGSLPETGAPRLRESCSTTMASDLTVSHRCASFAHGEDATRVRPVLPGCPHDTLGQERNGGYQND